MKNKETNNSKVLDCNYSQIPSSIIVFVIFILSVIIHFIFALLFRHGPTIQIDESLYINIAKSLAAGEGITYRSQPVPYMYIFYPLLLVPLYLFPLPFDLYRVIQLFNSVLISTSIFPVYLFSKDFTGNSKKAVLASAFTFLMPDLQMSGFLMSECVVWPLSLWLVFFASRFFLTKEKCFFNGIMVGIFTALLFWSKPGAIAMGLILLLSVFFLGEKQEFQKRRTAAFLGLTVCFGMILFFYALYVFVFGYELSLLGLYTKQLTTVSIKWYIAVTEFSFLQLFLYAVACCGIIFILPFLCIREFDKNKRLFILSFSLGLFVTAVGTAAFVDMFMWNGSFTNPRLHLRYMAMFIPVLIVFFLDSSSSYANVKSNRLLLISHIFFAFLVVFPGASVGFVDGVSTSMDSMALSAYRSDFIPSFVGILLSAGIVLFLLWVSIQTLRGNTIALKKQGLIFLALVLCCNNICSYIACDSYKDKNNYGADAMQMNTILETIPEEVLIITPHRYDETVSYCLESRLRKPYQQVTIDTFISALSETNGVYSPFITAAQAPNIDNHSTPETDRFLLGIGVANLMEINDSVAVQTTMREWFTLLEVPEGCRIADTMLSGIDLNYLYKDQQAKLYVFDQSRYKSGRLTLHLSASAKEGSADLEIKNAGKTQTITLSEKNRMCLISLYEGDTVLTAHGSDIIISSYWTD